MLMTSRRSEPVIGLFACQSWRLSRKKNPALGRRCDRNRVVIIRSRRGWISFPVYLTRPRDYRRATSPSSCDKCWILFGRSSLHAVRRKGRKRRGKRGYPSFFFSPSPALFFTGEASSGTGVSGGGGFLRFRPSENRNIRSRLCVYEQ